MSNSYNNLLTFLENINIEIKSSYIRVSDKINEIKILNNFISNILKKGISLEESLNKDEKVLNYIMNDFIRDIIYYITIQNIIYDENGDDIL